METDIPMDIPSLMRSEICQTVQLTSKEHVMTFQMSASSSQFVFEVNYRVNSSMEQHDCRHAHEIEAYANARLSSVYSCGQRRTQYTNQCTKIGTHPLNGLQGCRIECSSHDSQPFSSVHVIIRLPLGSPLTLCGAHSCPDY